MSEELRMKSEEFTLVVTLCKSGRSTSHRVALVPKVSRK